MPASPNPWLLDTATPPIPAARAWLARYDGRMGPPINLAQAVPGSPPPDALLEKLGAAARDPATASYGPILGEPALLQAYSAHISEIYGAPVATDEIAITAGCNEAFFVAALAVAKAGDAVLLPTPCYFNHDMTLSMLGIETVPLPAHAAAGFIPAVADAENIIAERNARGARPLRAIVLVSPNNPTGAVYSPHLIADFARLAQRHGLWLILDETYRDFLPSSGQAPHQLFAAASSRDALIQLYSFSKSYAIPGHRLGALVAPRRLMSEIIKVLDTLQICAPRVAQIAVSWAIGGAASWRQENAADVAARGDRFRSAMAAAPAWNISSLGAYFAFVAHPFAGVPDTTVAEAIAVQCGILALPGTFFGAAQNDHLRFAYANVAPELLAEVGPRLALLSL